MGIFDKAKEALSKNADKVEQAIDKAGDMIDQKTGNKHATNVDKGQNLAKEKLAGFIGGDKQDADQAPVPPVPGSTATPPAATPPAGAPSTGTPTTGTPSAPTPATPPPVTPPA